MKQLKLKVDKENILFIYILLSAASMNFFHNGSIIMFLLNICMLFYYKFSFLLDKTSVLYALLTLSIIIYAIITNSINDGIKALNYVLCFWLGNNGYIVAKVKFLYVRNIILAVTSGCFMYLVLILYRNIGIEVYRLLVDVWTDEYIAVTLVAVITSIVIAVCMYYLFFEPNKFQKIISLFVLTISLTINFRTATRTPFVLIAIIIVLILFLRFKSDDTQNNKIYFFVVLVFVIVMIAIMYYADAFSMRTSLESSFLWNRFIETDSDSRVRIMISHLRNSLKYPFGGGKLSDLVGKKAHNAIQDFYDSYGFAAGIFYLLITLSQIITLIKLIRLKNKQKCEYLLILVLFTASVQMCTEPIVSGYPIFIWIICIVHGMACAHIIQRNSEIAENENYIY